MPSILFLGATGYIGSAVFNAFINAHPAFQYTALVRTPSHAAHIREVSAINGTLEDRALVEDLASKADIVVNVARADDLGLLQALFEGLKRRKQETGRIPVLIHTCGGDAFEGRDVWDDTDEECIRSLLSRPVEQAILDAERQDILQAYFIAPTAVFGLNPYGKPSPFYLEIIRDLFSLPKPSLSSPSLHPLTSAAVKDHPNRILGMIDIDDLATLYLLVLDTILQFTSSPKTEYTSPRVYIASSSERLCISVYNNVVRALFSRGLLSFPPLTASQERTETVSSEPHFLAHRASTELGWKPSKPEWEHEMDWDVDRALEKLKISHSDSNSSKNA